MLVRVPFDKKCAVINSGELCKFSLINASAGVTSNPHRNIDFNDLSDTRKARGIS